MKVNVKEYPGCGKAHSFSGQECRPFITLSRSYGCDEQPFICSLINHLNQQSEKSLKKHPWRNVSNQIIKKTSRAHHLEAIEVENRIMDYEPFDEHSGYGRSCHSESDMRIMKTIRELMTNYARKGNVLFVGRGGMSVLHDLPNSLHLKLTAPLAYRTELVSSRLGISAFEAEEMIHSIDRRRITWTEHLVDKPFHETDFDLILNTARLSVKQMVDIVLQAMISRKNNVI